MNISGFQDTNVYSSVILIRHFDSYPEFNSGKALCCNGVWDCMFEFWRAWRRRLFSNGTCSVIIGKLIFLINFSLPGLSFAKSIMSDDESNIFKAEEAIKFLENGGKRMSNISFLLVCNLKC